MTPFSRLWETDAARSWVGRGSRIEDYSDELAARGVRKPNPWVDDVLVGRRVEFPDRICVAKPECFTQAA